ncbi:polyprenyl diphosphate synthase [Methylohalomonas lacus]|nr:polyprenyl diphosphate synthase [Methylohalomonas lacus]
MTPADSNAVVPQHVAIIMDGNGRWARQRSKARISGHRAGVTALRNIVEHAARRGVGALTVFAFSSENWRRPGTEVKLLMELFMKALGQEVAHLHANGVQLQFIGDRGAFSRDLREAITTAEQRTERNDGLRLVVAANYGGQWDIVDAARRLAEAVQRGELSVDAIDEDTFGRALALADTPRPDLFIRTGGEQRISNFLLWQLAYTELYFTDCLWPDFDASAFDAALDWYAGRERRFGGIDEQLAR